jgi:hypothetical protein
LADKAAPCRNRDRRADDAGFTQASDLEVGQMHRAALAPADAIGLADEFRHQRTQGRALADRMAVAAVIAGHVVAIGQRHAGADDLGFLANRGVNRAGNFAALHHLGGALVEPADAQHAPLHFKQEVVWPCHELSFLALCGAPAAAIR